MAWAAGAGDGVRTPVSGHECDWGVADQVTLARGIGVESMSVRDLIVLERQDWSLSRGQFVR